MQNTQLNNGDQHKSYYALHSATTPTSTTPPTLPNLNTPPLFMDAFIKQGGKRRAGGKVVKEWWRGHERETGEKSVCVLDIYIHTHARV